MNDDDTEIRRLLEAGADVNEMDAHGRPALWVALREGDLELKF